MTGIERQFPNVHALKNVNFDIEAGEVPALMDKTRKISDRMTVMRNGQYVDPVPTADTPINQIIIHLPDP